MKLNDREIEVISVVINGVIAGTLDDPIDNSGDITVTFPDTYIRKLRKLLKAKP